MALCETDRQPRAKGSGFTVGNKLAGKLLITFFSLCVRKKSSILQGHLLSKGQPWGSVQRTLETRKADKGTLPTRL